MTSIFFRQNGSLRRTSRPIAALAIVVAAGAITLLGSIASAKQVTVKVSEAPIKAGNEVVGTAKYGERFEVLGKQGEFYQVEFVTPQNQRRGGWLWQEHASVSDDDEPSDESDDERDNEPSAPAREAEPAQPLAAILSLHRQGRFREAIPLAERLVRAYEAQGGKPTPDAADAHYLHARLYGDLREHDTAFALYDRAVQASLDANGIRGYRTAACAIGLAEAAYGRGEIGLMRHCLRLTDQQWDRILGRSAPDVSIQRSRGVGVVTPRNADTWRKHVGETVFHDACARALMLMQRDPPSDITLLYRTRLMIPNMRALALHNMSSLSANEIDEIERMIASEKYDNQQLEEAEYLTDWALLLMRLGHSRRAETIASRGLELRRGQSDAKSSAVADSLHVLGSIKLAAKDHAGCRRRCLEALDNLGGFKAGSIPSAVVLRTLAQAAVRAKDLDEAALCGCQALRVYEREYGNDHADTVACRGEVAAIRFAQKKAAEALRLYDVAARGHYRGASALWTFADDELAAHGPHGNGALACAVGQRGSTEVARISAEWLINFKGLLTDRLARDFVQNRKGVARLARIQASIGRNHSGWSDTIRKPSGQTRSPAFLLIERPVLLRKAFVVRQGVLQQATPGLFSALQDCDRNLREYMAQMAEFPPPPKQGEPWMRLDELQKRLPTDTWLLECARYTIPAASVEGDASGYAVWVIPPPGKGDVEIVPLGAAGGLDRLIAVARKMLRDAGDIRKKNEASEERAWQEVATKLAKESLSPVWNRLPAGCRRLLIAPDGALWDIPWGALPVSGGKYALEQRAIDYLISERSLVHDASPTMAAGAAVVFADPNFDTDVATIERDAQQREKIDSSYLLLSSGISEGLPRVPRLPGTLQEAEAIMPLLKQMTDHDPILHTGGEANATFFTALKSPKVLVMSTHGFYLKSRYYSQPVTLPQFDSAAAAVVVRKPRDFSHPLDRCGLLLAGCNERPSSEYGPRSKNGDYGVLTGLTVSSTDLSATELVVLSACDTSLGQLAANGEVESLRQAFHIAGARQVVATLWPIPDKETVDLMKAFFARLAKHQTPAAALRDAQLEIIRQRRKEHGAAHPLYWAAFEMSLRQLEANHRTD